MRLLKKRTVNNLFTYKGSTAHPEWRAVLLSVGEDGHKNKQPIQYFVCQDKYETCFIYSVSPAHDCGMFPGSAGSANRTPSCQFRRKMGVVRNPGSRHWPSRRMVYGKPCRAMDGYTGRGHHYRHGISRGYRLPGNRQYKPETDRPIATVRAPLIQLQGRYCATRLILLYPRVLY
jgi:hypothetical protein